MKQSLINLLPPATVAAIWAFWGLAPTAWTQGPWAIMAVGLGTLAFVQLLELVFERHEGWRINGRELLTDIFYVAFGYGVIGFLSDTLVNGPLGYFPPEPIRYLGSLMVRNAIRRKERAEDHGHRPRRLDVRLAKFAASAGKADKT